MSERFYCILKLYWNILDGCFGQNTLVMFNSYGLHHLVGKGFWLCLLYSTFNSKLSWQSWCYCSAACFMNSLWHAEAVVRHILTVTYPSQLLLQCCGYYMDEDPTLPFSLFSSSRKMDCPAHSHLSFLLSAAHLFSCDFPTSQWFSGQVLSFSQHVFCPNAGIFQQLTNSHYPSAYSQLFFIDSVPLFPPLFTGLTQHFFFFCFFLIFFHFFWLWCVLTT